LIAAAEKYDAKHKTQSRSSNREQILYNLLEKSDQQEAPPTHSQPTASNTPIDSKQKDSLTTTTSIIDLLPPRTKRRLRKKTSK
jgi:hypothetical protein